MESDRAFIFHMCIPCGKSMSVVLRSRSSVMVKYQGHISHNIMNESKNRYTYHKSLNAVCQPGNCQFSFKFGRWQLGDRHHLQAAVCHRLMFSNYAYRFPVMPAGRISKSRVGYQAASELQLDVYSVVGFEVLQTSTGDR